MLELWQWVGALWAFDYGDPEPLSRLLLTEDAIPPEFKGAIADIVAGIRRPNRKAAAKLGTPAATRMKIASTVDAVLSAMRHECANAEEVGDQQRKEPSEVVRYAQSQMRLTYQATADYLGVSVETIEVVLRDMRARIARWPEV